MSLSEVQRFIFYNLVRHHIRKRRPIGSKILARKLKKFPPPTLRFYFKQISDKGYLVTNPDFLGREPTERGWHYYFENYKLKPEIKLPENVWPLEDFVEAISSVTKTVGFYREKDSQQYLFKGLKNTLKFLEEKEIALDLVGLLERLDKVLQKINEDFKILVGREIEESETKKLSLIIKKINNFELGFLGHKINYYHSLYLSLKNFDHGRRKGTRIT